MANHKLVNELNNTIDINQQFDIIENDHKPRSRNNDEEVL